MAALANWEHIFRFGLTSGFRIAIFRSMKKSGVERLREYRHRHGYKAYELAELLDLSEAHLSQIINSKRQPGLATSMRIEDVTGIPARSWLPIPVGRQKRRVKTAVVSAHVA